MDASTLIQKARDLTGINDFDSESFREGLEIAAEVGMKAWLSDNPQGRFGSHSYSLEKYGLSKEKLAPYFEDYLKRFDIEMEG